MFKGNTLEYGGTEIQYSASTRSFLFRSFEIYEGKQRLLESGKFRVFEPYTTIMSNGSHRGVREIIVINDKLWGGSVKVKFAILPEDFDPTHIDKVIEALHKKAKSVS